MCAVVFLRTVCRCVLYGLCAGCGVSAVYVPVCVYGLCAGCGVSTDCVPVWLWRAWCCKKCVWYDGVSGLCAACCVSGLCAVWYLRSVCRYGCGVPELVPRARGVGKVRDVAECVWYIQVPVVLELFV